jgi:predicted nucleotidyltransferase
MTPEIIKNLQEIEQQQQVCILYAVESGSRAWGFASSNSNYDYFDFLFREMLYVCHKPN